MGKMIRIEQLRACAAAAKNFAISHTHSEYAASNHTHEIYSVGTTAPGDTKLLWIDTGAGVTKYYNGSAWVALPVAWG